MGNIMNFNQNLTFYEMINLDRRRLESNKLYMRWSSMNENLEEKDELYMRWSDAVIREDLESAERWKRYFARG